MLPRALSRICDLRDFPDCLTVADWQQALAEEAWQVWTAARATSANGASVVVNYSDVAFLPPGVATPDDVRDLSTPEPVSAIYGLCVVEHLPAPVKFLTAAAERLPPAGLLFLTFAYWDAEGPDIAAGHDERLRIYSAHSYARLVRDARGAGFERFGGTDHHYHGHLLDDHSLASLVLVRR